MKYYIQNTHQDFLGNAIVFWAIGSNGYTAKLSKAEKFSFEEAKKICQNNPAKNKAWPVDYIDNNKGTAPLTDSQYLSSENIVNFNFPEPKSDDVLFTPDSLHPDSVNLLKTVFEELRLKMIANQEKYGWSNEWLTENWEAQCLQQMRNHLDKGDPRDVAIYAMFMIYRGWSTAPF